MTVLLLLGLAMIVLAAATASLAGPGNLALIFMIIGVACCAGARMFGRP